jgi:hypothetical protein
MIDYIHLGNQEALRAFGEHLGMLSGADGRIEIAEAVKGSDELAFEFPLRSRMGKAHSNA